MSRSTISIYTDQSLPTTYGNGINAAVTDLSGNTWATLSLELTVQNTGSNVISGHTFKLHYIFLEENLTPSNVVATASYSDSSDSSQPNGVVSETLHLDPNVDSGLAYLKTPVITVTGDYLYTWLEVCESTPDYANVNVSLEAVQAS